MSWLNLYIEAGWREIEQTVAKMTKRKRKKGGRGC